MLKNIKDLIAEYEKKAKRASEKEAVNELEKDLYFERKLEKDTNRLFKEITLFIYLFMLKNGTTPDIIGEFTPEMVAMLRNNYKKIASYYSTLTRAKLGVGAELSPEVARNLKDFINQQSFISANEILTTSQKDALIAFQRTTLENAVNGVTLTNEQIATEVKKILGEANKGRLGTIATTEVGKLAEASKFIEATAINEAGTVGGASTANMVKEWVAILDSKTRPAHAMADGQQVGLKEPFTVNGEQLMYPKDSSLGASAGNVINCRCKSIYTVKNENQSLL